VPLVPGRYRAALHFAEPARGKRGTRVFGILLEGRALLESFQPQREPGTAGEVRSFEIDVDDMFLDLDFLAETEEPVLAALEIEPVPS
jgi:hypothetical protein